MKTPKAEKLKSGNWRVQIQINGKRYSATAPTKKEAQDKAKMIYAGFQLEKRSPLTVGKAIDRYIEEKTGTLSPSTVKGYKSIRRNDLQNIMEINITELTQSDIQMAVSADAAKGKSPKSIRNSHGLLAAVLSEYRPSFIYKARLPQKQKYEARIPTEEEMGKIWMAAKGSDYEIPILLASWLGLRVSEIRGIKYSDISDGKLHVQRAVVLGEDGDVEKGTKTESGNRWIKLPKQIADLIDARYEALIPNAHPTDYIVPKTRAMIYKHFVQICKEAGVVPFRFHDLRHFAASESHALGIPDKYSMRRMGHKTDNMLKTVYQHTISAKEEEFSDMIDQKMSDIYESAHKNAHKK